MEVSNSRDPDLKTGFDVLEISQILIDVVQKVKVIKTLDYVKLH
jgi:hypothetical protein